MACRVTAVRPRIRAIIRDRRVMIGHGPSVDAAGMHSRADGRGDQQKRQEGCENSGAAHGTDHAASAAPGAPRSLATQAYRTANLAMHSAMDIEFSDNADIDFARGMIGHHQGAIDMARIMLEHRENPDLRQLAEEIIDAQETEIVFLRQWIAEHAPK